MSICDRCSVSGCAPNPLGKACKHAREREHPDVIYTNADKIRDMTDEELAEFISRIEIGDFSSLDYGKTFCDMCEGQFECDDCRLWWLRQPAKEEA
jgi:hypothetical protein